MLVILFERQEDVTSFFKFELTPFPNSLFKSFQMRKTNKAVLKHYLTCNIRESQPAPNTMFVLEGGALFHRVKWLPKMTYKDVVAQYLGYMKNKFGPSSIVFDGYSAGPSIKDLEHQRQAAWTSANIQIDDALQVAVYQEACLSNERNKDHFVKMLRSSLETDGHSVIESHGDADTDIGYCLGSTPVSYTRKLSDSSSL